jgi:hypothetical protein
MILLKIRTFFGFWQYVLKRQPDFQFIGAAATGAKMEFFFARHFKIQLLFDLRAYLRLGASAWEEQNMFQLFCYQHKFVTLRN